MSSSWPVRPLHSNFKAHCAVVTPTMKFGIFKTFISIFQASVLFICFPSFMCSYRSWCHFFFKTLVWIKSVVCCLLLDFFVSVVALSGRGVKCFFCDCCFAEMTTASAPSTGPAGRAAPTWWTCSSWEGRASTSWTEVTIHLCTWPPATDIGTLWERWGLSAHPSLVSFDINCENRTSSSLTQKFSFSPTLSSSRI